MNIAYIRYMIKKYKFNNTAEAELEYKETTVQRSTYVNFV